MDNFYKHYHNLDSKVKTQNNLNLLVYLLKTRWNHLILPSSFSLSKNIYYLKPEENLKDIINLIKKYHSSYIPSLYILRRLFPIILTFIEDILKIKINIYTFENEKSYINLINDNLKYFNKKDKISIIEDYFETLNCFLERIISSDLYYNFTKETKEYNYLSSMHEIVYGDAEIKIKKIQEELKENKEKKEKDELVKKEQLNDFDNLQKNKSKNDIKEINKINEKNQKIKKEKSQFKKEINLKKNNSEDKKNLNKELIDKKKLTDTERLKDKKELKSKNNLDELKYILENAFDNYFQSFKKYNWFSQFSELNYFCIYLSILKIKYFFDDYYNNKKKLEKIKDSIINDIEILKMTIERNKLKQLKVKEDYKNIVIEKINKLYFVEELTNVNKIINKFIKRYESQSYYLNYIDEEGSYLYIQEKYNYYFPNEKIAYHPTDREKFREILFEKKQFFWIYEKYFDIININDIETKNCFSEKINNKELKIRFSNINNNLFSNIKNKYCSEELYRFLFKGYNENIEEQNIFLNDFINIVFK